MFLWSSIDSWFRQHQDIGDGLSVLILHKGLLVLSAFSFTTLVWSEKIWKSETWVFNAPVNEYILAIFKMHTLPETFTLFKFHNSSFYTAFSEIYSESLGDMSLILIVHELPLLVFGKNFANFSRTLLLIFNHCFQIVK